jgi:hypothetical protein
LRRHIKDYSPIELNDIRKFLSTYKNSFSESEINNIIIQSKKNSTILNNDFLALKFWVRPTSKLSANEIILADCEHGEGADVFQDVIKYGVQEAANIINNSTKDDLDYKPITPQELNEQKVNWAITNSSHCAINYEPNLIRQLLLGIDSAQREGYKWRGVPNSSTSKETYHASEKDYQVRLVVNWNRGRPEAFIREFDCDTIVNQNHPQMLAKLKHFTKMAKKAGLKKLYIRDVGLDSPDWLAWWGKYTFELEVMGINVKDHGYGH